MVAVIRDTLKCCSFNSIWGSEEICPGQLWFSEELVLWAKNGLRWHWTARSKDQCSSSDSMGHQVSCGFRKEILLKDEKSKCCEMKNFSRTNQTDKKALSIMASQPIWKENSKSSAMGYVSPKVKSQKETPPPGEQNVLLQTDPCKHCWLTHVNILLTGFQHPPCWPLQADMEWNSSLVWSKGSFPLFH